MTAKKQNHFTENQLRIMEHLARFKFLTINHLMMLGIASHKQTIYDILRNFPGFSKGKYIDRKRFERNPNFGQRASVHYLKPKGVQFLIDFLNWFPDDIRYPKQTTSFFARDYEHRINFIDCHIALWQYSQKSNIEIEKFDAYFDYVGNNRSGSRTLQPKTYLVVEDFGRGYIIPDGIFITHDGKRQWFFMLEMAKGNNTKYILAQIYGHAKALEQDAPSEKYEINIAPRVLYVFEQKGTMQAVMKRFLADEKLLSVSKFFLFAFLDDLKKDFSICWENYKNINVEI